MKLEKFKCIVAVDQNGSGVVLKSAPNIYENDTFDGFYLEDNLNCNLKNIPREFGIYKCNIFVRHSVDYTELGREYSCDSWIDSIEKFEIPQLDQFLDESGELEKK